MGSRYPYPLASGSYPPEMVKRMGDAFDEAWSEISSSVDAAEAARLKLADIILSLASNGLDEASAETLKDHALRAFAQSDMK
jgi:hypothetical protein